MDPLTQLIEGVIVDVIGMIKNHIDAGGVVDEPAFVESVKTKIRGTLQEGLDFLIKTAPPAAPPPSPTE